MSISDALRNLADKLDETIDKKTVKSRYKDKPDQSTVIINALKKVGVPFSVAEKLYLKHNAEYIARKIFLYEFKRETARVKPVNPIAYILTAIKEDYEESDQFHKWLKQKREIIDVKKGEARIEFRRLIDLT